jgi:cysteine-rich repeat protein
MRSLLASCVVAVGVVVGLPGCRLVSEGIACDPDNPATCPAGTVCNADAVCVTGDGVPVGDPVCGDGVVNGTEACDFALDQNACNVDCTVGVCGDGKIDGDEACDDENENDGDGCEGCLIVVADAVAVCGDGELNGTEACDFVLDQNGCNVDCTIGVCGDGKIDGDEACDDENADTTDGCAACALVPTQELPAVCGDGVLDDLEACDFVLDRNACNFDCTVGVCGDGKIDGDEACDSNDRACSACQLVVPAFCGDGVINPGEGCDTANVVDDCNADCSAAECSDGKVSPAEACDDGNTADDDGCAGDCLTLDPPAFCGDGVVNGTEACELDDNGCNFDCTISACGDGVTGPDEQCDEGAAAPLRGLDGVSADGTFEIDADEVLPSRNWTALSGQPRIIDAGSSTNGVLVNTNGRANYAVQYDTLATVERNAAYTVHIDMGFASAGTGTTARFKADVGILDGTTLTVIATRTGSVTSSGDFTTGVVSGSIDFTAITGPVVGAGTVVVRWQQLENPGLATFFGIDNVSVVQASAFCRPSDAPNGCSIARCGDGIVDLNEQCDGVGCTPQCTLATACQPDGVGCFEVSFVLDNGSVANNNGPNDTDVVDFDNDGDLDIVSTNRAPSGMGVLLNNGNGSGRFAAPLFSASTGRNAIVQAIADYDNDGRLDIAVQGDNQISVFYGLGGGLLSAESQRIASGDDPRDFVAGDIDNDGRVDDCVGASRNVNGSHPFISNGGRPTVALTATQTSVSAFNPPAFAAFAGVVAVGLGDFDGDGNLDSMLTVDGFQSGPTLGGALVFQKGRGNGLFDNGAAATPRLGREAGALVVGDADADGRLDVVVALLGAGPLVAFGDGTGQLPTRVQLPTGPGSGAGRAAFSDFDGDGVADVIAIEGANVLLYRGLGNRTFAAPLTRALTGGNATGFALGDVDGDGFNDIVVTQRGASQYTVLLSKAAP